MRYRVAALVLMLVACAHAPRREPIAGAGCKEGSAPAASGAAMSKPTWLRDVEARAPRPLRRVVAVFAVRGPLERWAEAILADEVRTAAADALGEHGYSAVGLSAARERVPARSPARCAESGCGLARAREAGADLLVFVEVVEVGEGYLAALRLYDVTTGEVVATRRFGGGSTTEMLEKTYGAAEALFR